VAPATPRLGQRSDGVPQFKCHKHGL
jgi:hypothetical protein